ncbi:hypothetical protein AB0H37_14660 [Actinomadura sp. NPDC023710]|uniref:hypothetical protein n=1 Tax=Actinomadura sp. NPDC023710 TaxID=3158219 RepID=UPI0033C275BA
MTDPMTGMRGLRESIAGKSAQLLAHKVDHNGKPLPAPAAEIEQEAEKPRFQGAADQGARERRTGTVRPPDALQEAEARGDWATARHLKSEQLANLPKPEEN